MSIVPATDGGAVARLSHMWTVAVVGAVLLAVAAGAAATVLTARSFRPIGEGELLTSDARLVADAVAGVDDERVERSIRSLRNLLEIEAIGLVSPDGRLLESTSDATPVGSPVDPMLVRSLERGAFSAIASAVADPVSVDGVIEWEAGSVLYQALQPLPDGRAVLLSYDLTEMLERRADATRISPLATPLAIASGLLLLVAGGLVAARARAAQVRREIALESEFLRRRADDLEVHNRELARANAETEQALELAEEKNRIRSEFVLMINHELRTPLTGVVTGARLLELSPHLGPEDRLVLADVLADGERLERLISQMLAVARVENRGLTSRPVRQAVRDVLERLERAHRSASVRTLGGLDVEAEVTTDVTTLSQIVASLVDNAFTHGAQTVGIEVDSRPLETPHHEIGTARDSGVFVMVVDDGPGIDRAFLPRAFEKFEKQSFSSGTGLGLYMVRMMAESIGASLAVSTGDAGTVVAIGIPGHDVEEKIA